MMPVCAILSARVTWAPRLRKQGLADRDVPIVTDSSDNVRAVPLLSAKPSLKNLSDRMCSAECTGMRAFRRFACIGRLALLGQRCIEYMRAAHTHASN